MFELLIAARAFRAGFFFGVMTNPVKALPPVKHYNLIATPRSKESPA